MQQVQDALLAIWNWLYALFQANPILGMQLVIGLIAGWLASMLLGGRGLLRDLVIGMLGSVVGSYLQVISGYHFGLPMLAEQIVVATIGALIIIIIGRVIFR
jgi:uncharacterized membrane protein YeaQ/YmgE (transglycosylase-associated protein family)